MHNQAFLMYLFLLFFFKERQLITHDLVLCLFSTHAHVKKKKKTCNNSYSAFNINHYLSWQTHHLNTKPWCGSMLKNVALAVGQNIESGELQAKQDPKSCSTTSMETAAWQSILWYCRGYFSFSIDTRDLLQMPVQSIQPNEIWKQQISLKADFITLVFYIILGCYFLAALYGCKTAL